MICRLVIEPTGPLSAECLPQELALRDPHEGGCHVQGAVQTGLAPRSEPVFPWRFTQSLMFEKGASEQTG